MSNTIIDKKTDNHNFGSWPVKETVSTTLFLANMGSGKIGLSYDCKFSGVKNGHVQGVPIEVTENKNIVVNDSPKVTLIISNFNKTETYVSLHVKITVLFMGTKTIYNETLGGEYTSESGWALALASLETKINSQKEAAAK